MSWKTKKEKEDFFLSLDKAFNTPSTGTLVIPQIDEFRRAFEPDQHPSRRESKRRRSDNIDRDSKRRCSSSAASLTGVGIRNEPPEDPRPVKSTPPALPRSKSAGSNPKSSGKEIETPRKSNLLDGMVLFFIPNSRKNGVRRFRMTLFAQHGADIRDAWSDEITHIICDQNVNGDKVLQVMRWEQIPLGVAVVNELWIPESLAAGKLVDKNKERFTVPGIQSQTSNDSGSPEIILKPWLNGSLQLKPEIHKKRVDPETQSQPFANDSQDIQDFVFGRNSPPPAVLEREQLDKESLTPLTQIPQNALDDAILEVRRFGAASHFLEDDTVSPDDEKSEDEALTRSQVPAWQESFSCMHPHDGTETIKNPNSKTIEVLGKMQEYYERTMDQWRAIGYRKAISVLKKTERFICTEEQARELPGVGERLAKKISEIATTGELRRLQNLDSSDHLVELFMGIYGVGRSTAMRFVMQGFRSLQDVLDRGKPNESQRIGIELYDDFAKRIPREEVQRHSDIVREAVLKIDPAVQVYTMGSYRRGAETCGDIDMIMTKPNATAEDLMSLLDPLIYALSKSNFITHALASSHNDDGSKWLGVSRLPNGIHRRLDILFVPWKERGAALIYFTGNDIFNRSLRLLASKKGMGLNQRGLFKDTMRGPGRVKLTRGTLIASETEEEIFEILGVPWRPPEMRNC